MGTIRHSKVSGVTNPADPTLVGGEDWDASHTIALVDGDIPATIARDSEVTSAVAAEATARDTAIGVAVAAEAVLARNADNLASGTVADARIASTIARDSEVTSAVAAEATLARNADNLTSGTVADARIASTIARDSEVTSAITTHEAAGDPHPGYLTAAEGAAAYDAIGAAAAAQAASQPLDSDLTAFAALAIAADKLPYGTGSHTLGLADFTAAGRALVDDADASAQRTTLGLGTAATQATGAFDAAGAAAAAQAASQPLDATLTALAGLATGADKLPYSTGTDTFSQADLTAAARTVLDDASVSAMVDTLGGASATGTGGLVRATSPTLVTPALGTPASGVATNLTGTAAGLTAGNVTTNANLTGDVTSVGNATTLATVTVAKGGTNATTASGARTNLGLVIGTDVAAQAVDAAAGTGSLRTIGSGALTAAAGNHTHAGTGVAVAPELVKKYTQNATNTASSALTLTAHASGHRMIVVVGSYARDVNTPTCTNVTFTEIPAANFSTTIYLSFFVGVIAGGSSGTTLTVTAGSSNWIITDVYIVSDTLTPTAGTAATLTDTSAAAVAGVAIGPVAPAIGSFYIVGAAQNDGTSGFAAITMNAGDAIGAKITPGANSGLCSGIGRTCAANVYGYTTNGSSGGDFAAAIAIVS